MGKVSQRIRCICLIIVFCYGRVYAQISIVDELLEKAYQLRQSQPTEAFQLAQRALTIAQEMELPLKESDAFNRMAYAKESLYDYEEAESHFLASLEIRQQLEMPEATARAQNALADFYHQRGQIPLAMQFVLEAEQSVREEPLSQTAADIQLNRGNIHISLGELAEAASHYEQALQIHQTNQDRQGMIQALNNLGNVHYTQDRFPQALTNWRKADSLIQPNEDPESKVLTMNNLGLGESGIGKPQQAKQIWRSAIEFARSIGQLNLATEPFINYAWEVFDDGYPDRAIDSLKHILELTEELEQKESAKSIIEELTDMLEEQGRFAEALTYHRQIPEVAAEILSVEKLQIVKKLQTAQKEAENQWLSTTLQERDLQLFRVSTIALVLFVVMAALVGVGFLLRWRQKQEVVRKIDDLMDEYSYKILNTMQTTQEQERKRIAMELHDHIGSTLSSVSQRLDKVKNEMDIEISQFDHGIHLLHETITKVRELSREMFSGVLKNVGLVAAIEDLAHSIQKDYSLPIEVVAFGLESDKMELSIRHDLFRIVELLLSNILKHAQASTVEISLTRRKDELNVIVGDDGVGFVPQEQKAGSGIGLKSLAVRTRRLGGSYHIDSVKGNGTRISVTIPLPNEHIPESLQNESA